MITTAAPDFATALPDGGRLMGLDVGTKTIGVAFCDVNWSFATPDKTIIRKKFSVDLGTLKALVAQHNIVGLVVGLPLNMDGSDSPRTQSTRAFARNLAPLALPLRHIRPPRRRPHRPHRPRLQTRRSERCGRSGERGIGSGCKP